MARLLPGWIESYRREWLPRDLLAGVLVAAVVVPQAVAYADIAALPPEAGLIAAPGALIGYALLGTSRTLIVSATTATSALSAAAVGPIAGGDVGKYGELSAALALVTGAVLVVSGLLRIGGVMDLVSKPVITGFLFGLAMTVTVDQLPKVFGVPDGSGKFFHRLVDLVRDLDQTSGWTLAVGLAGIVLLFALKRLAPHVPGMLVVLVLSIIVSAALGLSDKGVAVVGELPKAYPHLSVPHVGWHDLVDLLGAAFGVLILSAEAAGVSRAIAAADGYAVDVNRDLVALGGSNALAGLSGGFVQSGGASQTLAAENAGGKTQLTSVVTAVLVLVCGLFLTGLFKDLPEATLAAIVVFAISSFYRMGELRRFARLRTSAIVLSLTALVGVLVIGVLPGLLLAAGLSLVVLIQRLSRPQVGPLARDPESGAWGRADRRPDWVPPAGVLVVRSDGPLFYANANSVKDRFLALVRALEVPPRALIVDLGESHDLDVETLDMLADLADTLDEEGIELRLAAVRMRSLEMLRRRGLADRLRIETTIDGAIA
ncbi:MAG TPA: SulP family inorganic anion transporter [Gaiellaceae bacterium]